MHQALGHSQNGQALTKGIEVKLIFSWFIIN
jgi:hypothetical protein